LSAALDARGASMGAIALLVFGGVVWKGLSTFPPVAVFAAALLAWALVSGTLWRLRRLHTRF
jgi:hypothetical protein